MLRDIQTPSERMIAITLDGLPGDEYHPAMLESRLAAIV
jgi:hypothetical protein